SPYRAGLRGRSPRSNAVMLVLLVLVALASGPAGGAAPALLVAIGDVTATTAVVWARLRVEGEVVVALRPAAGDGAKGVLRVTRRLRRDDAPAVPRAPSLPARGPRDAGVPSRDVGLRDLGRPRGAERLRGARRAAHADRAARVPRVLADRASGRGANPPLPEIPLGTTPRSVHPRHASIPEPQHRARRPRQDHARRGAAPLARRQLLGVDRRLEGG